MRVADFFCGAGGFSEGFRQKGFKVVFALDNWIHAVNTFEFNQSIRPVHKNILDFTLDEIKSIPDADIYVGSPPCTQFSKSNKGGNGNTIEGMALVKKYLQIIAVKKPKYWILENVPPLQKHLKNSYTFKELDLPGGNKIALKIPSMLLLNAANIGAPQRRKRFFCGNFPEPRPVRKAPTLGKVLSSLPNNNSQPNGQKIKDINYGFEMPASELTDHFYDCSLVKFEWKEALRQKQDHSFYGRMHFPENMNFPARTVMATQTKYSREAMILPGIEGGYRIPTIRESATLMTFPLTYQFEALTVESKCRLVGNAVIPLESSALAEAILEAEGIKPKIILNPHKDFKKTTKNIEGIKLKKRKPFKKRYESRFRVHIPYLKIRSFRVDLDNLKSFTYKKFSPTWTVTIHHGTGKERAIKSEPTLSEITRLFKIFKNKRKLEYFMNYVNKSFENKISDAKTFQELNCKIKLSKKMLSPYQTLEKIKKIVDKYFPERSFKDETVDNSRRIICLNKDEIPIRIVAGLYACKTIEQKVKKRR